jgi:hypothetical protein
MARKSLSAQVIDEVDRARGLLEPVQGIVDPMTAHMVGAVLVSLHRIETMCLAARQREVNDVLASVSPPPPAESIVVDEPVVRRPTTTHKARAPRKAKP